MLNHARASCQVALSLVILIALGAILPAAQLPQSRPVLAELAVQQLAPEAFAKRVAAEMAPTAQAKNLHYSSEIAPGFIQHWIRRGNPARVVHVFEIDFASQNLDVDLIKAAPGLIARERIEDMAQRLKTSGLHALAGINAGYWDNAFRPIGALAGEGRVYTAGSHRWTFLQNSQGCFLGDVKFDRSILLGGTPVSINGYNAVNCTTGNQLYTPEFGKQTPVVAPATVAVRLSLPPEARKINRRIDAQVAQVASGPGPYPLSADEAWILFLSPPPSSLREKIRAGLPAQISISTSALEGPVDLAVSAGPMLVVDGGVTVDPSKGEAGKLSGDSPRPRSGLGISRDGETLFLVAVEGAKPGLASGATLCDLAGEMVALGVWKGMNLDGGSSTSAWASGKRISRPAPLIGLRPISNALFVIERESARTTP